MEPVARAGRLLLSPWAIAALALCGVLLLALGRVPPPPSPPSAASQEQPDAGDYLVRDYQDILQQETPGAAASPLGTATDAAGKLALVLTLIGGLGWAVRRSHALSAPPAAAGPGLRQVGHLALSPHAAIHLVEAGPRILVVGVTAQQVSLLTELEAAEPAEQPPAPTPSAPSFLSVLATHSAGTGPPHEATPPIPSQQ